MLGCGHRCPSLCGEDCPDTKYCQECSTDGVKRHIVDMVQLSTYEEHNLDEDPILVLPCKHFYSTSTLDGHLAMNEVYVKDEIGENFICVRPLREADISEKPKSCPDCRSVIHSIRRYGRLLRLAELRSLERKHVMLVHQSLRHISTQREISQEEKKLNGQALVDMLLAVEQRILKSPMRKVYEACQGESFLEVPQPPMQPLLHTLELLGNAFSEMSESCGDDPFVQGQRVFNRGIAMADESKSIRSGAHLRLGLCSLLATRSSAGLSEISKNTAKAHLKWILEKESILEVELIYKARELIKALENPLRELEDVIKAMNVVQGYDYGGSWSSHWYECPNGHPYFIGECGGAMQESRCPECHEIIGGGSHRLNPRNRPAGGVIAQVLQRPR